MWENINGEWIYMDKELGADEYERQLAEERAVRYAGRRCADVGRGLSAGDVAVGVAGGLIGAKAVSRIGGWLFWIACLLFIAAVML